MSEEVTEAIAEAFHTAYEALAPAVNYRTRLDSAVPWRDVPEANKLLMKATVGALLLNDVIVPGPSARSFTMPEMVVEERPICAKETPR
jgi:hypothetical protein